MDNGNYTGIYITHDINVSVQVYMQYILVKSAVIENITFKSCSYVM